MNENNSEKKGLFDAVPSKVSFWAGFAAGIMAFCTIGFILILGAKMDWKSLGSGNLGNWGAKPSANANVNSGNDNVNAGNAAANVPALTENDHVRGDLSKAKALMIEYSDFECPYCKRFDPTIRQVFNDYNGDVAWVYRHFPLVSIHANAQKAAEASECVAELGGNETFWKFTDAIYAGKTEKGTTVALDNLAPIAKEMGVDQKKFQDCLSSGKYADKVSSDQQGGEAAGVTGTPSTFIINANGDSQLVVGAQPLSELKKAIDSLIQ